MNFLTNPQQNMVLIGITLLRLVIQMGRTLRYLSLLFHYQHSLRGAILHHPMVPRRGVELPDLTGKSVFITAGKNDPLCPPSESVDLQSLLQEAKAEAEIYWENNGHQLTATEVEAAGAWYSNLFK